MKKIISLLVALVILVVAIQPLFVLADDNDVTPSASQMYIASEGVVVDTDASSVDDGAAIFKVTLPANGGYFQFNQKLTDLVGGNATVRITVGENTRLDYETARFALQLTADGAASTDIVPVETTMGKMIFSA